MTSTIRLYNKRCELLTTLNGIDTTPRSWVLNKYGRCEFSLSLDDQNCTEQNLRFGNLVHVEHVPTVTDDVTGGKLPDWVGIILPPRTWDDAAVHVVAYSAEAILAYRAMPYITVNGAPDAIFRQIIELANTRGANMPFQFHIGQVDPSPITHTDELRTNAYDHINKLATAAGMEWSITSKIVPGSFALELYANLTNRRSSLLSSTSPSGDINPRTRIQAGFSLTPENTESQNPLLTEQGTILNHIFAYSQAATAADRTMQEVIHEASINEYGPFQVNTVLLGQTSETGLRDSARGRVGSEAGRPARLFKRVALDVADTFNYLRLGQLVQVSEPRVGFNPDGTLGFASLVRIVSMDYSDTTNKVNLNVEVIY
jgi:hypothetical protein